MADVRITFELRELAEVEPWGEAATPNMHWFGLTDGWYDFAVGDARLFHVDDPRGVDYYVARLWEDLVDVAPAALDDIPAALHKRAAAADRWSAWVEGAWDADAGELHDAALSWWHDRHVDTGYLRGAPGFHLWRNGDELDVRWRSLRHDNDPTWSSPRGDATTSATAFHDELVRFDRALIAAMQARVDAVPHWGRDIAIDLDDLRNDHARRATSLQRAFARERARPWPEVIAAVEALELRIGRVLD